MLTKLLLLISGGGSDLEGDGVGVNELLGHVVQHVDDCACDPEKNAQIARSRVAAANIVAVLLARYWMMVIHCKMKRDQHS